MLINFRSAICLCPKTFHLFDLLILRDWISDFLSVLYPVCPLSRVCIRL